MNFATRVAYLASTLATLIVTGSFTLSSMTLGSVLFAGTGGLVSQDNANFFWDDTNNRLGVGVTSPSYALDVGANNASTILSRVKQSNTAGVTQSIVHNDANVGINLLAYGTTYAAGTLWSIGAGASALVSLGAYPLGIGTYGVDQPIVFGQNTTEKMRLTSTGLGIGQTVPASKLEIFQTPTNASGILVDSQRLLISGSTTSNLARGIDWSYNGAYWGGITSNASSGKHLLYAAQPNNYWAVQSNITTSTSVPGMSIKNDTAYNASSGTQVGVKMEHTINQTSTAAFDSLLIDRTNTAVGSGNQNFLNLTTAGTMKLRIDSTGNIIMAENASVVIDPALSADGTYSGITQAGTAGATLVFGDVVYLAAADSRWELIDADAAATAGPVRIGIVVLAAAADGSATTILTYGTVRADANFPTFTIGAPVYLSTTTGDLTTTAPSGTDDVIRIGGYGNTADELFFSPSNDYLTAI